MLTMFQWDGRVRFATRSSFDNLQTKVAANLFAARSPKAPAIPLTDFTLVFELIAPENNAIVPCADAGMVLIGVRDLKQSRMLKYSEVIDFARTYELQPPLVIQQEFDTLFSLARDGTGDALEEGWVIRFETGLYLKLKTWQYLAHLHIQRLGLTRRQLLRTYAECNPAQWEQYLAKLPSRPREAAAEFGRTARTQIDSMAASVEHLFTRFSAIENQKDFAVTIQQNVPADQHGFLYSLRAGKQVEPAIRKRWAELACNEPGEEVVTPVMIKEWAFERND